MAQSREIEKLQRRWQENPLGLTFAPLAEAYRKEGMYDEALELLELGLAQHPNYVPAHIVSARCQLDIGADAKAEAAFLRVAELDPENVIALKGVADIAERAGRFQEAAARLEALLTFDRNNEDAKLHLSRVRAMLAAPSPRTIEPEPVPLEVAEPEPARPVESAPVPDAIEVSIAAPAATPPEPEPEAEPTVAAVEIRSVEPVEPVALDDVAGHEEETAPEDAPGPDREAAGPVAERLSGIELEEAGRVEDVVPTQAASGDRSDPSFDEPEPDRPDEVTAEVLSEPSPDLEVEVYHPTELTAGGPTEYQQPSDAEALTGGGWEHVGEDGERVVPLFAGERGGADATAEQGAEAAGAHESGGMEASDEAWDAGAESPTPGDDAAPPVEDDAGADEAGDAEEPELVVTETMAEVFLRQGHRELALAVYTQLRQREPDNSRILAAIDRIEQELRPGRAPALPAYAAALTGGRSVRSLFEALLTAPVPAPEADGLALGSVFGDEPAAAAEAEPEPESGPSFDEFFEDEASGSTAQEVELPRPAPASASEDIEEFNAWLRGLKR